MGGEFTPVFLLVIVAVAIGAIMIVASALFAPSKVTRVKQMPYESGMDPIGDARQRFDVRFYLVDFVFMLFEVELFFQYPWSAAQWSELVVEGSSVGIPAAFRGWVFWEIMVFIAILAAAFGYAWRRGVFEWR